MKIFLAICAFSAFYCSVICQPAPQPVVAVVARHYGYTDGPFWHNGKLFFVDPIKHNLCAYNFINGATYCGDLGKGYLSFAVPVKNFANTYVAALDKKLYLVTWDGSIDVHKTKLTHESHPVPGPSIKEDRLNFGTVDPDGTLWFGSIKLRKKAYGYVWSFSPLYWPFLKMQLHQPDIRPQATDGTNLGNGIALFHLDQNHYRFYFNNVRSHSIEVCIYDLINKRLQGPLEVIFNLDQHRGEHIPIEARIGRFTVDNRGHLWLPIIAGKGILEYNPYAKEAGRFIEIRASRGVSACAFGGPEMRTLYATTIGPMDGKKRKRGDDSGAVFSITGLGDDVWGFPAEEYKLSAASSSKSPPHPHRSH